MFNGVGDNNTGMDKPVPMSVTESLSTSSVDTSLPNLTPEEYQGIMTLSNNSDFQHLYQMIHDQDSQSSNMPQQQSQQFPATASSYRVNPVIDEATTMPFSGQALHDDATIIPEDNTQYISPTSQHNRTVSTSSDYHESSTISTLLGPSERIHLEDHYTTGDNSNYNTSSDNTNFSQAILSATPPDYGGTPRKRLNTQPVDVDKLFDEPNHRSNGFSFQKFGVDLDQHETKPPVMHSSFPAVPEPLQINDESSSHAILQSGAMTPNPERTMNSEHNILNIDTQMMNSNAAHYEVNMNQQNTPQHHYSPSPSTRINRRQGITGAPGLSQSFPDQLDGITLKIITQPETQHRARYMTEGSRGAVKDVMQQGHPVVQLLGWTHDCKLEIFIGSDSGKVKPHGFYQACRIAGKNSSPSKERQIDGTVVIEMEMSPNKNMTATIDCVGILKLRNTDVEKRIGLIKTKKKSTKCRMIFRVSLAKPDGATIMLQTASNIIACTQPAGQPEISRISLDSSFMSGGQSLFVIGKNFVKGFRVKFQEVEADTDNVVWEKEAEVEQEFTQNTHFICTIPMYNPPEFIYGTVSARMVVEASGGVSEPVPFQYICGEYCHPKDGSSHTSSAAVPSSPNTSSLVNSPVTNSPRSIVAPEALELVAQLKLNSSNSKMFQIPEGVDFISQPPANLQSIRNTTNDTDFT